MKRIILTAGIAFVQWAATQLAISQSTVLYMSSIDKPSGGSLAVASNAWWAQGFATGGTSLGGYAIDSVQLRMADGSGMPSGFTVSLYSADGDFAFPANSLWTLSGPTNPSLAGVYNYTGSGIVLSPNTGYFIVVTASQPLATGSYRLGYLGPGSTVDKFGGWILGHYVRSEAGLTWGRLTPGPFQFAIYATPIPEPSCLALLGLGGGWLLIARRFRGRRSTQ